MEKKNRWIQYLITCSVSLASVMTGVSTGWPTPVIPKFHANETDLHISDVEISYVAAMTAPGFMTGSFISRYTSDYYGRRITILGSALPTALGTVLIIVCSTNVWLLYVTRFLWGIGTGIVITVTNIYISEIADPEIRGSLSVATRFMYNGGTLLVMIIGLHVSYSVLNYMLLVLPILFFCACFWIPETPYFLMKEGKVQEAKKALIRLKGHKDSEVIEEVIAKLQADVKKDMKRSSSLKELFTGKRYRKAVIVAIGLKIAQMYTGGIMITQFLGIIMKESKSPLSLSTAFIIYGVMNFIVGICSSMIADRVGRRPLLIYSLLGTAISLATVGLYFFMLEVIQFDEGKLVKYAHVAFVCIVLSNVISTLGFQSIINIIPAEIFPLNVKAIACTCVSVLGGFLVFTGSRGYQAVKDVAGLTGVFWVFSSVGFIGAVFVYLYMPETKGKTLRDIQIELQGDYYDQEDVQKMNQVVVEKFEAEEEVKMLQLKTEDGTDNKLPS